MSQKDEPNQKNYVYKLLAATAEGRGERTEPKFFQIRVKSINFFQKSATAVYFYDISSQVKSLQLGAQLYA